MEPKDIVALIDSRAVEMQKAESYYRGALPRLTTPEAAPQEYRRIVDMAVTPWAGLVVDSVAERLTVTGFRVSPENASDEESVAADSDAWEIWTRNSLDVNSTVGLTTALTAGRVYLLVEPNPEGDVPRITFEHPSTVYVHSDPWGRRLWGAKAWRSGGETFVVVWTPESVETYKSARNKFVPTDDLGWPAKTSNPLGAVPLVEVRNRPDLLGGAYSDLDGLYPLLNRIAQSTADLMTAQLYSSVKARYLIGAEAPLDEEGNPDRTRALRMAADQILMIEDPEARAGTFDTTDLRQIIASLDGAVRNLASVARVPISFLVADLVNLSADALRSSMESLSAKVRERQLYFSDPLEEALRLAFRSVGDPRGEDSTQFEVVWADPLPFDLAASADAASKLASILPAATIYERVLGATPQEVAQIRVYARQEAMDGQGVADIQGLFGPEEETPGA